MESFPVVLRCEDVCVAVPITILINESTIFRAMYTIQENSGLLSKNSSASAPTDSTRDKPIKHEDEDSNNNINSKQESETNRNLVEFKQQVDLLEIQGYCGQSVKTLFEYLKGYNLPIEHCEELNELADILLFCNSYDIKSPIAKIKTQIYKLDFEMNQVLDALETLEKFGHFEEYEDIYNDLFSKCVAVATENLDSQQKIIELLLDNQSQTGAIMKLLEHLYDDCSETIRFEMENVSELEKSVRSPTQTIRDIPFHIEVQSNKLVKGVRRFGFFLRCEDTEAKHEHWMLNCKFKIKNVNADDEWFSKTWFRSQDQSIGFEHFLDYNSLVSESNGYIKDDQVTLEVEIICTPKLEESEISKDDERKEFDESELGVVDVISNEFYLTQFSKENDSVVSPVECLDTGDPVILKCNDVMVAINQSILVKESSVFKRMLSHTWKGPNSDNYHEETYKDKLVNDENTKVRRPKHQVEVVEITGFSPIVVRVLFEWLKGYTDPMLGINSFHLLGQLMMLCDFYAITSPVNDIVLKMIELPITMSNLLEAFAIAKSLEMVEAYEDVAVDIIERCSTFARCNLGCWKNTLDFVIRNKDNIDFSLQLLRHIRDEKEISVRMKIKDFSKLETLDGHDEKVLVSAPTHLFRQSKWNVHLRQKGNTSESNSLGFLVLCNSPVPDWDCIFKMEMKIYNWKSGCFSGRDKEAEPRYINGANRINGQSEKHFIRWKEILDKNNHYLQDDTALVEVRLSIVEDNFSKAEDALKIQELKEEAIKERIRNFRYFDDWY